MNSSNFRERSYIEGQRTSSSTYGSQLRSANISARTVALHDVSRMNRKQFLSCNSRDVPCTPLCQQGSSLGCRVSEREGRYFV
jgi:hypothetical protein